MNYRITGNDRKKAIEQMQKIAGMKAEYTRMPRCAYILKGIAVEKNGNITLEEGADEELLRMLVDSGLVEDLEGAEEAPEQEDAEEIPAQEVMQEAAEEVPAPEETAEQEAAEEAPVSEETIEQEDLEEKLNTFREGEPLQLQVSLPLSKHRAESLRNLIFSLYSKGSLLSKSTGGRFYVSEELVNRLQAEKDASMDDVVRTLSKARPEDLSGITLTDENVTFDGFPETEDPKAIKAWTTLVGAINRAAIKQNRIRPIRTEEPNEKFAFRVWLTRLEMNGPDLKEERSILYKNLSGHTAFHTDEDAAKWKARQEQKRQELKEQKKQAEQ